jgi:opacity protein-like surface antigen
MKILIRLFVFVLVLTMASESFAQTFGLKGGLNLANMLIKNDDKTYSDDFKTKPGFHLGVTAEFPATEMFSFETGLLLSTKGFKTSSEDFEEKVSLLYLDIPLTGKASFDVEGVKVYGVFGPYIGMGLFGIYKTEDTYEGETETESESIVWGSEKGESDFKRFDMGLTMGAGVEINVIQIGLTYNLGLANISPYSDKGYKRNNRVLALSIGYKFGGN